MDQNQFAESGNSPPPSLPILMPADVAEIRENARRIGLHTDEGRCYCPRCVERRNTRLTPAEKFQRRMLRNGFNKEDGVPLDDKVWSLWLRSCSLEPLDPRQFNFVWSEPRFTKPSLRISPPLPNHEIRNVSDGEKAWRPNRGKIPSPSTGGLVFDSDYLEQLLRRHSTTLAAPVVPSIADPFEGRSLTAAVGTENRSIRTGRDAASYRDYIGGCETELPAPKPDTTTYVGPCTCPRSTGLKNNGEPKIPHDAKVFVYPDGAIRVECFHENYGTPCMYLGVWKLSPTLQAAGFDGIEYSKELQKRWEKKLREQRKKHKLFVHSIHEKTTKTDDGEGLNEDVDINVDENGDEVGVSTPAEAVGLDWIEDDATRKSEESKFEIDNKRFREMARRFIGFPVNVWSTDDAKRIPYFSPIAWAYELRTRYTSGDSLSDSEHRHLRYVVNLVTAFDKGLCPSNTCPHNECANPDLSLNQRNAVHLLNQNAEEKRKRVGQCFCVVFLGGQYRLKWLPDVAQFDGDVTAAFHELVRCELKKARGAVQRQRYKEAFEAATIHRNEEFDFQP